MHRRLIIVSHRLPVRAEVTAAGVILQPSSGGLATGVRGAIKDHNALWIGWPGELPPLDADGQRALDRSLAGIGLAPVYLDGSDLHEYYDDIANAVLWPVLHGQIDQLPLDLTGWEGFVRANRKFAQAVAEEYRPGDLIWIHDYQLALVPQFVREQHPEAAIGYFLHVPFPPYDTFNILPWREEMLRGILGADLVGFHTTGYVHQFAAALQRTLGIDVEIDRFRHAGREIRLGAFPLGVDAAEWSARSHDPGVVAEAAALRKDAGPRKLLLGVDRLDYTKGIRRRCMAVERLLESGDVSPEAIRFVQVTVPSREGVEAYDELRRQVDELVGRINSRWGTATSVPIHHMHQELSVSELSALYLACDVLLVTPLRDGMNLVAKEFIATRADGDGVLVLSEFAGAASELGEALDVNPYDLPGMAATIGRALNMPEADRRARMAALRERVMSYDAAAWAEDFVARLGAAAAARGAPSHDGESGRPQLERMLGRLAPDTPLVLLLDYDGTLVDFAATPAEAQPDPELMTLLADLAMQPHVTLHVISGRTRESMDAWFGSIPCGLHAEHGLWSRTAGTAAWTAQARAGATWRDRIRPILQHFTDTTRGTFIEEKTASIAWHYRGATADHTNGANFGDVQARELKVLLASLLSNAPVEVLYGHKVIEVRPQGVNKGMIVPSIVAAAPEHALFVAVGDDRTDEDLFAALPDGSITIRVGAGSTGALYNLGSVADVREVLRALAGRAFTARVPKALAR